MRYIVLLNILHFISNSTYIMCSLKANIRLYKWFTHNSKKYKKNWFDLNLQNTWL